ncbi:MAG: GNAT family N-acetyltransferase [Sphingomonadaceae bacterium]
MADREAPFTLRRATAADAPAVRDLFCRSFTATFGHLYPPHELAEWLKGCTLERFRAECGGADHACQLGLGSHGRLLGYCTLGPQDLPVQSPRRWWVLRQLYLEESAKGTGLAQALMAWALGEARTRGFEELLLTVWIGNHRARRFYEAHGFEEIGHYPFRVGSTIDDDRILSVRL